MPPIETNDIGEVREHVVVRCYIGPRLGEVVRVFLSRALMPDENLRLEDLYSVRSLLDVV